MPSAISGSIKVNPVWIWFILRPTGCLQLLTAFPELFLSIFLWIGSLHPTDGYQVGLDLQESCKRQCVSESFGRMSGSKVSRKKSALQWDIVMILLMSWDHCVLRRIDNGAIVKLIKGSFLFLLIVKWTGITQNLFLYHYFLQNKQESKTSMLVFIKLQYISFHLTIHTLTGLKILFKKKKCLHTKISVSGAGKGIVFLCCYLQVTVKQTVETLQSFYFAKQGGLNDGIGKEDKK